MASLVYNSTFQPKNLSANGFTVNILFGVNFYKLFYCVSVGGTRCRRHQSSVISASQDSAWPSCQNLCHALGN